MGGGIFTKAAAVGAALSVLNEYRSEEDDKRIPEGTTDIVDDTVGVTAGLGVVLLGTFAEATCAALVLAASSDTLGNSWKAQRQYRGHLLSLGSVVGIRLSFTVLCSPECAMNMVPWRKH